jgi:hypothetical protein
MRTNFNPDSLVDIRDIRIDGGLPQREQINEYNRQIKDLARYKCGKLTVTVKFQNNGVSIEKCLESLVTA